MPKDFTELQRKMREKLQQLPRKIGVDAMRFFQDNFKKQGFVDKNLKKWAPRKADLLLINASKTTQKKAKKKKRPSKRGILRLTGELRNSLKYQIKGNEITVFSRKEYANIHNEGLPMKNGKRMPKRQFVGNSDALNKKIKKLIERQLNDI